MQLKSVNLTLREKINVKIVMVRSTMYLPFWNHLGNTAVLYLGRRCLFLACLTLTVGRRERFVFSGRLSREKRFLCV